MSEKVKDFLASVVGVVTVVAGVLSIVLGFLYVRDDFTTPVPILLWGSVVVFFLTLIVMWRYKRVRESFVSEILGSIITI